MDWKGVPGRADREDVGGCVAPVGKAHTVARNAGADGSRAAIESPSSPPYAAGTCHEQP